MNPKYIVDLCTDVDRDCVDENCMVCPYREDATLCKVVIDAINTLRHPEFHTQAIYATREQARLLDKSDIKIDEPTIRLH